MHACMDASLNPLCLSWPMLWLDWSREHSGLGGLSLSCDTVAFRVTATHHCACGLYMDGKVFQKLGGMLKARSSRCIVVYRVIIR